MTSEKITGDSGSEKATPSTLPFDPESLAQGIRVRPAQFARMCAVSKQAVSGWVRAGKITLFPDGTLDPARAAREVIANTDPGRLRARIFKTAVDDVAALRRRIAALELELQAAKERRDYLEEFSRELIRGEEVIRGMLIEHEGALRSTPDSRAYSILLETLFDEATLLVGEELGLIEPRATVPDSKEGAGAQLDDWDE